MKKILVIHAELPSAWQSCKSISSNLKSAYSLQAPQVGVEWFRIPAEADFQQRSYGTIEVIHQLKEKLRKGGFDRLVFIDHLPQPFLILRLLSRADAELKLPPVVIHLYGDFTYFSGQWQEHSESLQRLGVPITWICASDKQADLLRGFLGEESQDVHVVPFPIDPARHFFEERLRQETRSRWGLQPSDQALLYTGRISLQKNVHRLIQEFAKAAQRNPDLRLFLAGGFDDLGGMLFGMRTPAGYYFQRIQKLLRSLPQAIGERVHFLGHLSGDELRNAYCAADVFTSLSLYHDEDYGMSVGEALATGLPALITDWGGYSSFAKSGLPCRLVPVGLHDHGILLSSRAFQENLQSLLPTEPALRRGETRPRIGRAFCSHFSVESAATQIRNALRAEPQPFAGFNWKLSYLAKLVNPAQPDSAFVPGAGTFYSEIYRPYFTKAGDQPVNWNIKEDLASWIFDYFEVEQRKTRPDEDAKGSGLKKSLWPFCEPYWAPTQPVFLFDGWHRELVEKGGRWHARDGILPAFWFFRDAKPADFPAKLLMHEDLAPLVPPEWQEHILLYRPESNDRPTRDTKPKGLILTGVMAPPFIDQEELEEQLDRLVSEVGTERLSELEILTYFPYRGSELFWHHWNEDIFMSLPLTLTKKLGTRIRPVTWSQLESLSNLKGYLYCELNKGWLIKDSFVQHLALSKGATLVGSESRHSTPALKVIEKLPLSPHHSLVISQFDPLSSQAAKEKANALYQETILAEYARIGEFIYAKRRFSPMWPEWFQAYCKGQLGEGKSIKA